MQYRCCYQIIILKCSYITYIPIGDILIKGVGIKKFRMDIFDRWGEKLFSSKDITQGWKGTFKSQPCEVAVYVYKIAYKGLDGKKYNKTGHITLNR